MRTTVDLPSGLLTRAKRIASQRGATLSGIVSEALGAYLERKPDARKMPFKLLVRGRAGGRFPTPGEIADAEADDQVASLEVRRRAPP